MARDGQEQEGVYGVYAVWVSVQVEADEDIGVGEFKADLGVDVVDVVFDAESARRVNLALDVALQEFPKDRHGPVRR